MRAVARLMFTYFDGVLAQAPDDFFPSHFRMEQDSIQGTCVVRNCLRY